MDENDLRLIELTDVDLSITRGATHRVDTVLMKGAEHILGETTYVFGDFHVYRLD